MLELTLMKQMWNITSSAMDDPQLVITTTPGGPGIRPRVQTDIKGLMNNQKMPEDSSSKICASSAWMSYPISLYDVTKINFTAQWDNYICPKTLESPINCSPQGGFALVFQQESATALGEFRNNLAAGLGYEGLSGVLAIEFDTFASIHNDQPITNNLQVSVQVRNSKTRLLTSRPSSTLASNSQPINFGNFNRTDFNPKVNISVGLIPNQNQQTVQIVVFINGIPQVKTSATFRDLGIDPNRIYYVGFTAAQNLNRVSAATANLNIINFRLFKGKPKFVDGQVSYLRDYTDAQGNNSLLEIRSSFYDLCMQKTTMVVYPTVSIDDWLNQNETEPRILSFLYNRDTFVIGSKIDPLKKTEFYKPGILQIRPDVKFQMSIPTGKTQAIRMGFYWGVDLIMNITAIDYFRQQQSSNFAFIVIDNSDIITGTLSAKGYANNNYQFNVQCYDKSLNPSPVLFSQLQLSVTSDYIRLNESSYSNVVPTTCYGVQSQNTNSESQQQLDTNRNYLFTCTFMPNVNGTYYINSPFLPSGRSFKVEIDQADSVNKILSSEYSQAIITGDFTIDVGSMVEVYIDLRDYLNNTYRPSPDEGCTFTKSYYIQNGQKYSFLFYDGFPYLRTRFTKAGVAEFKITISCIRMEFDLQCFRCQKLIQPLTKYFYYKVSMPAYPSQFDVSLDDKTLITLAQGTNLAVDVEFYDRYDNVISTELNQTFSDAVNVQLVYQTRTYRKVFTLSKALIPGRVMLTLQDADNLLFKSLSPRTNTYSLEIQVPKQEACFTLDKQVKNVLIVPQDKLAPIESVGDQDVNKVDPLLSTIQWDRVVGPGKIGRLSFTVRNSNFLQLSTWPSTIMTDFLEARIIDPAGKDQRASGNCLFRFGFGLYEGEYFGWYQCKQATRLSYISILYQNQLLQVSLPMWTLPANGTSVDRSFYLAPNSVVTLGNGVGLNLFFRVFDEQMNTVDTVLIDRDQPHLGQITYNLTRFDTGVVTRFGSLPMFNTSQFFRIALDNLPVGRYRLDLNLPTRQLSTDFTFNSSSQRLSPLYSLAVRENGQQTTLLVNSQVSIRLFARNIHNQSIDKNADSALILAQCRVQILASHGLPIHLSLVGNFRDTQTDQVYYKFSTNDPIRRNGRYVAQIYFPDSDEWMYVQNSTFVIQDRFDPSQSELYIIKGLEQKEYRMISYEAGGSLENSFNATHYDPKIDGSLKFKMYLRTNIYNDLITQDADFTYVIFRNAYIAQAQYSTQGTFTVKQELTSILLQVWVVNNEYLMIQPASWADQDAIDKLAEGYYFLYVQGLNFQNQFELRWIFSLFNSDLDPTNLVTSMNFFAPRFINITAGEPFTFTAVMFGNKSPKMTTLSLTKSDGLNSIEIDKTSDNLPAGYLYYITIYHETVGIYRPEFKPDTLPTRELVIQVNPAPFYQVRVLPDGNAVSSRRVSIGIMISFNFTFVDRYGNNIYAQQRDRPSMQKIQEMVQVVHQDRKPLTKVVRAVTPQIYQANFTSQYAGIVSLVLPFTSAQATNSWQTVSNFTFDIPSTRLPSVKTTYAFLRQRQIQAGAQVQLEIRLMDEYENRLTQLLSTVNQNFTVNIVPDNTNCNTSTLVMPFNIQIGNALVFSTSQLSKSCLYQFQVYYTSLSDGLQTVPCVGCYLRVLPAVEDFRKFEFLDSRDALVSSTNQQTIYVNKFDWNPKLIMTMRDQFGNLVLSRSIAELSFNYTFDLVLRSNLNQVQRAGTWDQFRSFHLISFCNERSLNTFCMQPDWSQSALRIRQVEKNTGREISRITINLQIVDNLGAFYNSDQIFPLSANYTHLRVLNQDAVEQVGQDLQVLQDHCVGGDHYPIIGRIDLRTTQGFRFNQSFTSYQSRLQIKVLDVPDFKYQVTFYPGNNQGQVIFIIFVKDDYYVDTESAIARLYIDGEEQSYKNIILQCDRKLSYNEFLVNPQSTNISQPNYLLSAFNFTVVAGEKFQVNMTAMQNTFLRQPEADMFLPYDQSLYINYTNSGINPVTQVSIQEDPVRKIQTFTFSKLTQAGNCSLLGSGIPDSFFFNLTVIPGLPSAEYSQVFCDQLRVTPSQNETILVQLADRFGNLINLTDSPRDIQMFNNYTQVFFTRIGHGMEMAENWQMLPRESCFGTAQGRMRCSTRTITDKGLYKWRVVIRGEIAPCINCYFRVIPTGRVSIANAVVGDLSQNYHQNQQFAMGSFNVFPRRNFIQMKLYLKDEFENVYIHEDLNTVDPITPRLVNSTVETQLSIVKVGSGKANNAQVYKVTVQNIAQFSFTKEGLYQFRLVSTNLGTINYSIYIKDSRTAANYVPPKGTSTSIKTRERASIQNAGKFLPIQFGLFAGDFLLPLTSTDLNQVQFSNALPASSGTIQNGNQMVAQYKGLYEKYQRFTALNYAGISTYLERFTVTITGFDSTIQGQFFQTTVFPGAMSKIVYQIGDQTKFRVQDSFNNDLDFTHNSDFLLQVVQSRGSTSNYDMAQNDFKVKINYTERVGIVNRPDIFTQDLRTYSIIDSIMNVTDLAFMGYGPKFVIDYDRSSFSYSMYQIIAGRRIVVRANILDTAGQPVLNIPNNNTMALRNLTVHLISVNTRNPAEFTRRIERVLNFSDALIFLNGTVQKMVQVNISTIYYISVRFNGVKLQNLFGGLRSQWIYVDVDPNTGISRDLQWSISMAAVQKNKIYSPMTTPQSLDYVQFMKGQPVYFIAKLCDKLGNPFQSPYIYDLYNVGDTALSSRIKNYGDKRQLALNTVFMWNFLTISATDPLNRGLLENYVPSFYPLVNNDFYDNQKSYKLDVFSPSNTTTQNVNLKVLFLVITSDFALDRYHSVNVTNSQELDLKKGGIVSTDFDEGLQIKIRQRIKNLLVVQIRNDEDRPYLAELIISLSISLTNVSLQNTTVNGKIVSVYKLLETVNITIMPYVNDAFYRVLINSSTLYQDEAPLNVRATVKTLFKYNLNPQTVDVPLWVFPQTPPNFLNSIVNTTYLARGQTKFQPASKITFQLVLKNNDQIYMNDRQSAGRIKVFRKSNIEYVTAQLINKTHYNISVNLEGPQTNQFRIYYQDTNKAFFPLIGPDVLYFEINTAGPALMQSKFEDYYYEKLGYQSWMTTKMLRAYDPSKIRLVLIPNMFSQPGAVNNSLTYFIGNEFRASILVVDSQTSRCLTQQDYLPFRDIQVVIQRYDPITKLQSRISMDLESILLVQKLVSQSTSYCAFYSIAVLESQNLLNLEGNYSLTAKFLPNPIVQSNLTFQARISGIDFTKTTIGWYQQPTSSSYLQDKLIAEFNAYEEFNFVIYFQDVQSNYVSDRQQYVKIQIKFDQYKLIEEKDYRYISRYDDRFKGYLLTITLLKAGSYQPEYYFNLQKAEHIQVSNGPVLFVVREPQCVRINVLSESGSTKTNNAGVNTNALIIGQLFNLVFHCFDINGKEIRQNIDGLQAQAVFTNINLNDQLMFVDIEALQNGIYRVSNKFYLEGVYTLKIYFNNLLIYNEPSRQFQVISELCKDRSSGSSGLLLFKCPQNPSICANSYQECPYINQQRCTNILSPFLCGVGGSASDRCVSNMHSECCKINDRTLPDYKWCPHTNTCINVTLTKCPSMMPSDKPYLCESKGMFVENRTQCCGDFKYNVTRIINDQTTIVTKSMVKCSFEDKCVPEDTAEFCFYSFERNCQEIFGPEFTYKCPNDGKCKRSPLECPSPRVCPTGYTQCPDYTCIRGLDKFNQCNKLQNCTKTLADGSIIDYIRCPDASCSRTYEDCPSQVSCMNARQVVCPDGSCQDSEFDCIQPNECTSDKPYKCPGFPSVCARSRNECPLPSSKSCGGTLSLCTNGLCSSNCKSSQDYFKQSSNSQLALTRTSCGSLGLVQCPNGECRANYFDCSDTLFCPVPLNYTYSPQAIICPGAQVCALNRMDCTYSKCESGLNNLFLPSQNSYDQLTTTQTALETCYDGRCHIEGSQIQRACMTPISCSNQFFKSGGFGEFCVSKTSLAEKMIELSIILGDYNCPSNKVKCVTGECRSSFDDCPSQITCPADYPILCRDGQCVKTKTSCKKVDEAIERNLYQCQSLGMLLCTSDLITCSHSLSKCPSRSSCPIGYIKCWDESCINPQLGQDCPSQSETSIALISTLSTCQDQEAYSFHCFADGSCRKSLNDCPSISYCPSERPVKCAADNSCRKSIQNCPKNMNCPIGYKFCPGDGNCIKSTLACGSLSTCSQNQPIKCEDGSCVSDLIQCFTNPATQILQVALSCLEDDSKFLCSNDPSKCVKNLMDCPASLSCSSAFPVKSYGINLCHDSRDTFSGEFQPAPINLAIQKPVINCADDGLFECWDGTCASEIKYCRTNRTQCPPNLPVRCNFTANCVSKPSDCLPDKASMASLSEICQAQFGMKGACPDGSCAVNPIECRDSRVQMECPMQQPYKCSNGLCVKSKQDCPLSMFSIEEIKYCSVISQQSALNLQIPCGNGQCMETSDQCAPLYDCSLNLISGEVINCQDGTCRDKLHKCPQIDQQYCPTHIPIMCQNGQCAKSEKECFLNENGCPQSYPFKCPFTGQCTVNLADCTDPITQVSQMFIYPNYIPPVSATPFIAIYGKTRSICQSRGQFTCRLGSGIPYCVDRLNDCILADNNCPVNQPIRCGNTCVTSYLDCQGVLKDNCTSILTARCPSQGLTGGQCANGPKDFSNCLNMDGCSIHEKTFLCAPQIGTKPSCSALPYSNYPELATTTCKTFDKQPQSNPLAQNSCTDQDSPYSCAVGSCVALPNQCPTCIYYCPQLKRCTRSQDDCNFIATQTSALISSQLSLECPLSSPVRCILNGQCVTDERLCQIESQSHINKNYIGPLISEQCPFNTPIQCQDGRCVDSYDECIKYQRARINVTNPATIKNPIQWGVEPDFKTNSNPSCQVLCYDGSCRERVENCPVIQGCYDPQRPQRCRSGFCARDKNHCFELFGDVEKDDQNLQSDSCSNIDTLNMYHRCEDGTCRQITDTQHTKRFCQPFMGCPVSNPYHCPTGECARSIEECAGSSQCPLEKPIRCKNFKCASSPSQCDRAFSTYNALQIDRTFDPYEENTVSFAFDTNGFPIVKLKIPSSAFKVQNTDKLQSQIQTLQRIQLYPVPDSILDQVKNKIADSRISYLSRIYSLQENKYLSRALTLLSPAVKIDSAQNSVQSLKGERYLQESQQGDTNIMQKPLYIYFKFDNGSFPFVLNMQEDICLGRVDHIETLIQKQSDNKVQNLAAWYCEKRHFNMTPDGFLKFRINTLGIYALIINPNPDVKVETAQECGFYCQNHLTILILLMCLSVLLILVIFSFCECCKQHSKTQSKLLSDLKRTQQSQQQQDSFFGLNQSRLKQLMPAYITQEAFLADDNNALEAELNMERVRDVLDNLNDPADPPLMPGQVVMYLAHQSETQTKQIDELKYQLQEQNEREKENLKLIKRIFHQKQLIYEQMQVESEIKSQSRKSRSIKAKKRKEAINDPSIKKEYEDIEAYLSKILSETHLPEPYDPSASQATFQQYPGRAATLKIPQSQQMLIEQQSYSSIPVVIQTGSPGGTAALQTDSIKNMIATQKQSQSTTQLELNQGKLQRKAADMLMRNLDAIEHNNEVEQFQYEERAEGFLRLKRTQQPSSEDGGEGNNDGSSMFFDKEINNKFSQHRDTTAIHADSDELQPNMTTSRYRDQYLDEGLSGTGLMDSLSLNQTLNQLFSKARKPNVSAKTYFMLMSGGAVSGTVSGNLVKALSNKFQQQRESYSNSKQSSHKGGGYLAQNGIDEDESDEDDFNQTLHYEDYQEKTSTPKKR